MSWTHCRQCGYMLLVDSELDLMECPKCKGTKFTDDTGEIDVEAGSGLASMPLPVVFAKPFTYGTNMPTSEE